MTKSAIKKSSSTSKKGGKQTSNTRRTDVPLARSVVASTIPPRINGKDGIFISRKEFVGTATNGAITGFSLTPLSKAIPGYDFNPSIKSLFPWLSTVAASYERFRFRKLEFHFIPSQSASTAGRFYAAVDYDYDDAPSTTKATMMGNHTAVEAPVWQECHLKCDPACLNRDMPFKFVTCTTRGLAVENRTSYSGFLMLGFDTTVANLLMDIWVSYEVELVTPVLDEAIVQDVSLSSAVWKAVTDLTTADTINTTGAVPIATGIVPSGPVVPVNPGVGGVPNLTIPGNTKALITALDILATRGVGSLLLQILLNESAATPYTVLGASVQGVWSAFDYLGNFLGNVSAAKRVIGPSTVAGGATLAGAVSDTNTIDLSAFAASYPTARYLAPWISAVGALGAGNIAAGFQWSA